MTPDSDLPDPLDRIAAALETLAHNTKPRRSGPRALEQFHEGTRRMIEEERFERTERRARHALIASAVIAVGSIGAVIVAVIALSQGPT